MENEMTNRDLLTREYTILELLTAAAFAAAAAWFLGVYMTAAACIGVL